MGQVTQEAIDDGRISAARSDAASRLAGDTVTIVEQPLIGMDLNYLRLSLIYSNI